MGVGGIGGGGGDSGGVSEGVDADAVASVFLARRRN